MRHHYEKLRVANGDVLVVSFVELERLRTVYDPAQWPFKIVSDPLLETYRAFGIGRQPIWRIYSIGTIAFYARAILGGSRYRRAREDNRQMGADIIIDSTGVIRYAKQSFEPVDRPSVEQLRNTMRGLA